MNKKVEELVEKLRLTEKEQDECVATSEQLEAYLREPDDEEAANLSQEEKRLVAKCILYGVNIAQAQLNKVLSHPNLALIDMKQATPIDNQYLGKLWVIAQKNIIPLSEALKELPE